MKLIFSLLATLLPTSSVSTIVSVITGFAAKLEEAERRQLDRASDLEAKSMMLMREAGAAKAEADRARRVAKNISSLAS